MFFKPKWYRLLQSELKTDAASIEKLEKIRKSFPHMSHEIFAAAVTEAPQSTRLLQYKIFNDIREKHQSASHLELIWAVLDGRLKSFLSVDEAIPQTNDLRTFLSRNPSVDMLAEYLIKIDPDYPLNDQLGVHDEIDSVLKDSEIIRSEYNKSQRPLENRDYVRRKHEDDSKYFRIDNVNSGIGLFKWNDTVKSTKGIIESKYNWSDVTDLEDNDGIKYVRCNPPDCNIMGFEVRFDLYFLSDKLSRIIISFPTIQELMKEAHFLCYNQLDLEFGINIPQTGEYTDEKNYFWSWEKDNTTAMLGMNNGNLGLFLFNKSQMESF